jgi:hypothetical protein
MKGLGKVLEWGRLGKKGCRVRYLVAKSRPTFWYQCSHGHGPYITDKLPIITIGTFFIPMQN